MNFLEIKHYPGIIFILKIISYIRFFPFSPSSGLHTRYLKSTGASAQKILHTQILRVVDNGLIYVNSRDSFVR
jgi:hypothetical protein